MCGNNKCIPQSWTCNKFNDCGDNSDESPEKCSREWTEGKGKRLKEYITLEEITCKPSEYRCENLVCISDSLTCDGSNDCGDWSDELKCGLNECLLNSRCQHMCVDDKIGFHCLCRKGYELADDGLSCVGMFPVSKGVNVWTLLP